MSNMKAIAVIGAGIMAAFGLSAVSDILNGAERSAEKHASDEAAKAAGFDMTSAAREIAGIANDIKDRDDREKNAVVNGLADFCKEIDYDRKLQDIKDRAAQEIEQYKTDILNYDECKAEALEVELAGRKAYLERVEYGKTMDNLKSEQSQIESDYNKQKLFLSATNSNGENDELLKTAKKLKKDKISAIGKKMSELEKGFADEKTRLAEESSKTIAELDKKLAKTTAEINKAAALDRKNLQKMIDNKASELRDIEIGKRTEQENGLDDLLKAKKTEYEHHQRILDNSMSEIYMTYSKSDKLAMYFTDKEYSKGKVQAILYTPVAAVGGLLVYGVSKYVKFVSEVVNKMN